MRNLAVFILFILPLTLSSCAFPPSSSNKPEEPEVTAEASLDILPSETAPSREAVFISDNQSPSDKPEIILKLNAEPYLMPSGYVRLIGIIDGGGKPMVLLDIGGRSVSLELFDEISNYRLVKVFNQTACLRRER